MSLSPRCPSSRRLLPALLASLLVLGGCTSLRDSLEADNVEYRNARRGPGLDVPPDLDGLPNQRRLATYGKPLL